MQCLLWSSEAETVFARQTDRKEKANRLRAQKLLLIIYIWSLKMNVSSGHQ